MLPGSVIQRFLGKMLRDNYFEEKFSEDAKKMQKSEVHSFLNVNILPYEVDHLLKLIINPYRSKESVHLTSVLLVNKRSLMKMLLHLTVDICSMLSIFPIKQETMHVRFVL